MTTKPLPDRFKSALMGDGTSKINKAYLAICWKHEGYEFDWEWNKFRDQVKFNFGSGWVQSKCFDDIYQAMKEAG